MSYNKIRKFSSIVSIALILCMLMSVLPPSVFGATATQEPVTKDGTKYVDVTATAGNSSVNLGDKITANGANYDITLDGEKVGSFVFNKNAPYIEIRILSNIVVDILWNCGSKYAYSPLIGAGTYKIPQLFQDNGKTQNFDAIWVTDTRSISILDDTDGDGLPDWLEIEYGMNPNNPDTLGDGILDGDRVFTVTQTSKDWNPEDRVKPILNIQLQGKYIASLSIDKVPDTSVFLCPLIPGYISNAYDFNVDGSFESATLTFEFASDLWDNDDFVPAIYYWNEEIQLLEELPDQIITENTVTVLIEHFSSYILLNNVPFNNVWRTEIKPPNYSDGVTHIDLAIVIDNSGSMDADLIPKNDRDRLRHVVAKDLIDKLSEKDRVCIVNFQTEAFLKSSFTFNKQYAKDAVDDFINGGTTALYPAIDMASNQFRSSSGADAVKLMIVLTDGMNNNGGTLQGSIDLAVANNVIIYTVGLGTQLDLTALNSLASSTGGKYYHAMAAQDLIGIFDRIAEEDLQIDTDNDELPDYFAKFINAGILTAGNGVSLIAYPNAVSLFWNNPKIKDTNSDGLWDGEEILLRSQLNSDGTYKVWVYMYSNPCVVDTTSVYAHASTDFPRLSPAEQVTNAEYIYNYLSNAGWSKEAICGLLGNIEHESHFNPGMWEYWHSTTDGGYGIVQWDPATKFLNEFGIDADTADKLANSNPKKLMDMQLEYLIKSCQPSQGEWLSGSGYTQKHYDKFPLKHDTPPDMSFQQFIASDYNAGDLALVFNATYERSNDYNELDGEQRLQNRYDYGNKWLEYFSLNL